MQSFMHHLDEVSGLSPGALLDLHQLSVTAVAAAGAMGMSADGPPVTRSSPQHTAVALLCREGHLVLHAVPHDGICLVDILARPGIDVQRGADIIRRRLAG